MSPSCRAIKMASADAWSTAAKHDPDICGSPCTPNYLNLVSTSSGPTYWRVVLQGITASTLHRAVRPSTGLTASLHSLLAVARHLELTAIQPQVDDDQPAVVLCDDAELAGGGI